MANSVALFWRISYVVTHTLAGAAERLHRSPFCGIRFLFRIDKSGQKVCGIRGGKMRREYAKWKSSREIRRIIIRNSMSGRREQDVPFNHPQAIGKFHSNPHPWGQRKIERNPARQRATRDWIWSMFRLVQPESDFYGAVPGAVGIISGWAALRPKFSSVKTSWSYSPPFKKKKKKEKKSAN